MLIKKFWLKVPSFNEYPFPLLCSWQQKDDSGTDRKVFLEGCKSQVRSEGWQDWTRDTSCKIPTDQYLLHLCCQGFWKLQIFWGGQINVIFLVCVMVMRGVTNHPSWVANCLHSKVLCTGIVASHGQHETGFKSPRLRGTVSNRLIMFL